jgi:hypothetical protein
MGLQTLLAALVEAAPAPDIIGPAVPPIPSVLIDQSVIIAAIVAISSMTAPILLAWMTNRTRHQERMEDYARQDQVAKKAEEVAKQAAVAADLLAVQQRAATTQVKQTAELLVASNERADTNATATNIKLDVIHTLVNSNMTAAMQAEYDATVREAAMMREVVSLKQAAGHDPTIETLAAIEATDKKIADLRAALADRLKATEQAATDHPAGTNSDAVLGTFTGTIVKP